MLKGASELPGLPGGQGMHCCEMAGISKPHGLAAVVAEAALRAECSSALFGRSIHERLRVVTRERQERLWEGSQR